MSAIAALDLKRSKTSNHVLLMTHGGTTEVDFTDVTLTPEGIDKNGVAMYRDLSTVRSNARTLTFSTRHNKSTGKSYQRIVCSTPQTQDDPNDVDIPNIVDVKVTTTDSTSNRGRVDSLNFAIQCMIALRDDLIYSTAVY